MRSFLHRPQLLRWLVALVATGTAWLAIETSCWVLLRLRPATGPIGRFEFRGQRPAPYRDADYFGPDFLDESMRCVRLTNPEGTHYLVAEAFQGRWFHVANHQRHTTDQPASWDHRVLVFGGSTVFDQEVPDFHTLPSCLQRALNQRPGPRYRVENHGTPAMMAYQQTERLRHTPLHSGDLVLFYDGVNDVNQSVFNGRPEGYHLGDRTDGGVRKMSGPQRWLYPLCFRLQQNSCAAAFLFQNMDGPRPATLVDRDRLARNLDAAEAGYGQALTQAREHAEAHGARLLHVLQPHLFSLAHPSDYERTVIRNELLTLPGIDEAFRLGYPRLRQAVAKADQAGLVTIDLTAAFDERPEGEEYYLDFCHVNHTANARLAQRICEQLFSR